MKRDKDDTPNLYQASFQLSAVGKIKLLLNMAVMVAIMEGSIWGLTFVITFFANSTP